MYEALLKVAGVSDTVVRRLNFITSLNCLGKFLKVPNFQEFVLRQRVLEYSYEEIHNDWQDYVMEAKHHIGDYHFLVMPTGDRPRIFTTLDAAIFDAHQISNTEDRLCDVVSGRDQQGYCVSYANTVFLDGQWTVNYRKNFYELLTQADPNWECELRIYIPPAPKRKNPQWLTEGF